MSTFLYQAAADAARYARLVFNRYWKKPGYEVIGETIEPEARIKIELGYVRKWMVEKVERSEFHTSKHLNKVIEAYVAKNLESIMAQAVKDLEDKAIKLTVQSRELVAAELAMIDAARAANPNFDPEPPKAA